MPLNKFQSCHLSRVLLSSTTQNILPKNHLVLQNMLFLFNWSTMASTLTWSNKWQASSTHPGCQPPLLKKHDSAPSLWSHPGRSRGHQRRWSRGPGTPGPSTCSQTGTKCCCYCRDSLTSCPAASRGGGPRRSGACSPGGGSTALRLLLDQSLGSWTQKCARRAYTGCSLRRTAHKPPGSRRPLLWKDETKQPWARKLAKQTANKQNSVVIGWAAVEDAHLWLHHS